MPVSTHGISKARNNRNRARRAPCRRHYLEFLEQRQLLSSTPVPPPVQTYYLPVPAEQVFKALSTIHTGPKAPVSTYTSIAVAQNGTHIYYDQWENGFASDIANPTAAETYNSATNPAGVQIWGDGDPANGAAPGYASDILHAGDVFILASPSIAIPRNPSAICFDGGDKIATTKSVAIGMLNYAAGTDTLLSGALQVDPTSSWGTNYKVPIGQNTANMGGMFGYTGLAIMASKNGTTVKIDTNGDGTVDKTVTLNEGQSYLVNNGVKMGATVVSTDASKPIQVNVITGMAEAYGSRWFNLTPMAQWSNSYYTAVSTKSTAATVVFLYNPSATAITVTATTRGSGGTAATLTTTTITVPAKSTAKMTLLEGSGAHFSTAGGQPFYAVSTTDFGNADFDWGMALIPESQLTGQALVGLGFGRDPSSTVNPTENSSPVWVSPVGNGNTPVTVYVDFNGDNAGALTDPNGYHYDQALSLKELQSAKIFDPDGNQTAMLVYTLDPAVKLAVSWGEDPALATITQPGIDAGTNIAPLPELDAGKSATLAVDANHDSLVNPGDTLQYTVVVNNNSRTVLDDLKVQDFLPANLSYVGGTFSYTITTHDGAVSAPITVSGATFPMSGAGFALPALTGGATFTAIFSAKIDDILPAGMTHIVNTGDVTSLQLHEAINFSADTPIFYDLGGLVFQDINRNGAAEGSEPGIAGVTVKLMQGSTTVDTTTTDVSGHYVFIGPALGTYTIDIVNSTVQAALPDSDQTAGTDPSTFILSGGGAFSDAGIDGFMTRAGAIPSALSGFVTVDGTGVAGVTLTLTGTNAAGTITPMNVLTGADGSYLFPGVMTGTYAITETQPAGLLDGADFAGNFGGTAAAIPGDRISGIALPGESVGINYNFTELQPASLGGQVFNDANNNGARDAGEGSISGVTLTLSGSNDLGAIAPIIVTSAADGSYTFSNLRPGTYAVTETQPAGRLDGLDAKAGVVIAGSNASDVISGLTLATGTNASGNTFGELLPANLGGSVYVDANNNGAKDAGEAPLAGVTLTLTGTNDVGSVGPTIVTSATDGSYTFGNLRPGTYTITETQPAAYLDGLDNKAGVVLAGSATTDTISGLSIASGNGVTTLFGELAPATISGFVYVDANNNGVKDSGTLAATTLFAAASVSSTGEAPIGGATITLTGTNDLGPVTATTTTAADGSYSFGTLRPGTYTLTETQPAGYLDGLDNKAGVVITGSYATDVISGLVMSSGSTLNTLFGEIAPASVSGYVYIDADNNGAKDAGETPLGGVTLTLTGTNDIGAITAVTVTTAVDGSYTFGTLRPGTYAVTETQPATILDGLDAKDGTVIPGSNATDTIAAISLSSGGSTNVIFGELSPCPISGFVYIDSNNNGIKDAGEAGIGGTTVTLSGSNDLGAISPIIVTTAANGSYDFGALRPGTYTVTESQPAGYFDGLDNKSGDVLAGSTATDVISGIAVTSGSAITATFGELRPSSIAGSVYAIINNASPTGLSGVTLTLSGSNDLGAITSVNSTTAADGSYSFGSLRPGTYVVTITQPADYTPGAQSLGTSGGTIVTGGFTQITIAENTPAANYIFRELQNRENSQEIRMTGGGSVFLADTRGTVGGPIGTRVTHGFELHGAQSSKKGDITTVNNHLEINWNPTNAGAQHFHLLYLTAVTCLNDPNIDPQNPSSTTGLSDTLIGVGQGVFTGTFGGKRYSREPATITFILTDAGEPGVHDTASFIVTLNKSGKIVLNTGDSNGDNVRDVNDFSALTMPFSLVKPTSALDKGRSDIPDQLFLNKGNHQVHLELKNLISSAQNSAAATALDRDLNTALNSLNNTGLAQNKLDALVAQVNSISAQQSSLEATTILQAANTAPVATTTTTTMTPITLQTSSLVALKKS